MNVPLFIAARYLFGRKSHNVINVISAISAAGMAIGTAALILILSVYNGFDAVIEKNVGDISPDLLLVSGDGAAHFRPDSALVERLAADSRVRSVRRTLEENVFLSYGDQQGLARAKGVEEGYGEDGAAEHVYEGEFRLRKGELPNAVIGATIARKMGIHPRFTEPLTMYYPDREGRISPTNPAASARSEKVFPAGLMSISSDTDAELVIVPLELMRSLMGSRGDEVSGMEIMLADNSRRAVKRFKRDYSAECTLLDRYEQQPTLFKMMKYEKAAVFLILLFVVIIVALNIFGSLSMLIIEKQEDIGTLHALGADDRMVKRIFMTEGWLVSLAGLAVGLVIGITLALLQQHLGIVKMPGNFLMESYPVVLKAGDVLLTAAGVALTGFLIAAVSAIPACPSERQVRDGLSS